MGPTLTKQFVAKTFSTKTFRTKQVPNKTDPNETIPNETDYAKTSSEETGSRNASPPDEYAKRDETHGRKTGEDEMPTLGMRRGEKGVYKVGWGRGK